MTCMKRPKAHLMGCIVGGNQTLHHLPSDVEAPEWPFEPVVDDTQTFEVLVPIDDDGEIIAEVDDFRGKDCDVVLPEVAKSLGEIKEER